MNIPKEQVQNIKSLRAIKYGKRKRVYYYVQLKDSITWINVCRAQYLRFKALLQ